MMAEIVNLRQARKVRARQSAEAQAAENRARFGRSKAARAAQEAEAERQARLLAGSRLEPGEA
jgi:hypothetical protein